MESVVKVELSFFKDKKVFVTGHTGFKGTWLCHMLVEAGAIVTGYALEPPTQPSLFELTGVKSNICSVIGDIRDYDFLYETFMKTKPDIVIHLAAQPIVLTGYKNPRETYETNVMGTVNILECVRLSGCVRSFLNVTTDKVYQNNEWVWGYRESDVLNGYDPYSNSKSCSELVTESYKNAFSPEASITAISTARAGNVIGGGDFAKDRIIPDCVRAAIEGKQIIIRNPASIRPYQHVLEPLFAYLTITSKQYEDGKLAGNYNVGPDEPDCITTKQLVDLFCEYWGNGLSAKLEVQPNAPHEAGFLKLDCSKIKSILGWKPRWHIDQAIEKTIELTRTIQNSEDIAKAMNRQIKIYLEDE